MKLIYIVLFMLFAPVALANTYQVQVSTDGLTDDEALNKARIQVQWLAALDFPVLVSGTEHLDAWDQYSSELTALAAGAVEVSPLQVSWDRQNNMLTYMGSANLNTQLSIDMISEVKDNIMLQRQLQAAYDAMDTLVKNESSNYERFTTAASGAQAATYAHYARGSYQETMHARNMLRQYFMAYQTYDMLLPFFNSHRWALVDVGRSHVHYEIVFDWLNEASKACKAYLGVPGVFGLSRRSRSDLYAECFDPPIYVSRDIREEIGARVVLQRPWQHVRRDYQAKAFPNEDYVFRMELNDLSPEEIDMHLRGEVSLKQFAEIVFFSPVH